jgi:hypothetical protein
MTHEEIAKVVHQANKAYCESLGDKSQVDWEQAPGWQKKSYIEGVKQRADHAAIAPAQMHTLWMKSKEADGWVYGETKDTVKKTHPCMVPYKELPVEQQVKDHLFLAIASTLLKPR